MLNIRVAASLARMCSAFRTRMRAIHALKAYQKKRQREACQERAERERMFFECRKIARHLYGNGHKNGHGNSVCGTLKINMLSALLLSLLMAVALIACDGGSGAPPKYTCTNGTAERGRPSGSADVARCASCDRTYKLSATKLCDSRTAYICPNGGS